MSKFCHAVVAFVLKNAQTPFGKAVEHAAVAGAAAGGSFLVAAAVKGNLDLTAFSTVAVLAGTTVVAGVRAYFKKKVNPA